MAPLELRYQAGEVEWVEANGAPEVNGGEYSALDQSLDGARMDAQEVCRNLSYVAASAELVTHATPVERGRLIGATDLGRGLLAAGLALLGGAAYSEWGVVALAVGATVAVVAPALVILLARRAPPAEALEPAR